LLLRTLVDKFYFAFAPGLRLGNTRRPADGKPFMSYRTFRSAPSVAALALLAAFGGCTDQSPDRTPAKVTIVAPRTASIASGATVTLTASVTDAAGDVLPGMTVQWTSTDATIASVTAAGVVTGVRVGDAQIMATLGTLRSLPIRLTVTPGVAATLTIRTQPSGAASGLPLASQPVVEIRDASGNLVTSAETVTAVVATGGGAIAGSTTTAVGGVATFTSLAISGAIGPRTLAFSVGGLTPVTSTGFELAAGAASILVMRIEPAGAAAGAPLTTQPVIEIRDAAGNLTTSTATVTATIVSGGGSLTGASTAAIGGVASFTNLTLAGAVGSCVLAFNADGLVSVTSAPIAVRPGAAVALRLRRQPGGAIAGQLLAIQPVVEIVDAGGNPVPAQGVVITATLTSVGVSITGSMATSVDGVATFSSLTISGVVGSYPIRFTADGLVGVTSLEVQVAPGAATHLAVRSQPLTAENGVPVSTPLVVVALDAAGNVATSYNFRVVFLLLFPVGPGSGSPLGADIVNGVGTFPSLTLAGPLGTVTLEFFSGSLAVAKSLPITLTLGPAARLGVTIAPPSMVSDGVPMVPQPVFEVLDAGGNHVSSNVTITVSTDAPTGSIANGTATAVNGVATFSGLTLSGSPGSRNYAFSGPGISPTTFYITIQ